VRGLRVLGTKLGFIDCLPCSRPRNAATLRRELRRNFFFIVPAAWSAGPNTAKAILLLEATDRGMSAQDLDLALTSYARLQAEIARRALGSYRTRTKSAAIPPALAANS
jgi:hypothetical protein